MVLFAIIRDIFRDDKHSGWWKAIWFLFLMFLPFLTALVYLVRHSEDMNRHRVQEVQAQEDQVRSYIRSVADTNPASEIAAASKLLEDGHISAEEFAALKARVLA